MIGSSQNQSWKYLFRKLVFEYCLLVGSNSQLTSKKITKYILGTRDTVEIFKLYELRYLLLKIYPLIHLLFQNPRVNSHFEFQPAQNKFLPVKHVLNKFRLSKKKTVFSFQYKNSPPQILFATTTEAFADIISEAANICNMPYHKKRWVNGFITAAISDLYRNDAWDYTQSSAQKETAYFFAQNWSTNKEDSEQTKEKSKHFRHSRWPSLVVIPDPVNNEMIISEIKKIGLPVIGLINSHCSLEIDYPLFAQDQTYTSVYFFCHFLAVLIAKEMAYTQHKHYILQKQPARKQKNFADAFFFGIIKQQKQTQNFKRFFFFRSLLPAKKKSLKRHQSLKKVEFLKYKWIRFPFFHDLKRAFKKKNQSWKNRKKRFFFSFHDLFWQVFHLFTYLPDSFAKNINDFFWLYRLPNIARYSNQRPIEKKRGSWTPRNLMFKSERKNKRFSKQANFFLDSEKRHRIVSLLQNFLWIFKKINFHWQSKIYTLKTTWENNNSYYWWVLRFLVSDFKWQQHKYLLHKSLRLKKDHPNYQTQYLWRKKFAKPRRKKSWKNHILKTQTQIKLIKVRHKKKWKSNPEKQNLYLKNQLKKN